MHNILHGYTFSLKLKYKLTMIHMPQHVAEFPAHKNKVTLRKVFFCCNDCPLFFVHLVGEYRNIQSNYCARPSRRNGERCGSCV